MSLIGTFCDANKLEFGFWRTFYLGPASSQTGGNNANAIAFKGLICFNGVLFLDILII
jgi:hypothetical protein